MNIMTSLDEEEGEEIQIICLLFNSDNKKRHNRQQNNTPALKSHCFSLVNYSNSFLFNHSKVWSIWHLGEAFRHCIKKGWGGGGGKFCHLNLYIAHEESRLSHRLQVLYSDNHNNHNECIQFYMHSHHSMTINNLANLNKTTVPHLEISHLPLFYLPPVTQKWRQQPLIKNNPKYILPNFFLHFTSRTWVLLPSLGFLFFFCLLPAVRYIEKEKKKIKQI